MRLYLICAVFCEIFVPGVSAGADQAASPRAANKHYVVNREPLRQTAFVHLPAGSVKARGWLRDQLRVQADGITSYLWTHCPVRRPMPTRLIIRRASFRWPWCLAMIRG